MEGVKLTEYWIEKGGFKEYGTNKYSRENISLVLNNKDLENPSFDVYIAYNELGCKTFATYIETVEDLEALWLIINKNKLYE